MLDFKLEGEYIQLIALLKATNLVASGGEAQLVVLDGLVKCNGEVDLRKRLKVRRGDTVEYNGTKINVQ
ncbi:RNA-binding S4 domain-containing protein [Daejeonella lutea]|uniref:Ribosome-associated protein n=1 Tax=Daejeonella lutea TaxID=572036 RepID=A0A1T5F480_9SPHI|nr:RNA-binding S4 domain-containing protein [Daejeonella lutea]SKB90993.1 ribosome-associated protein [Daejeonella lutea]